MPTKEEILDSHLKENYADREKNYIDDYGVHEHIEDAMEEYAKQEALNILIFYKKMQSENGWVSFNEFWEMYKLFSKLKK